MNWEDSLKDYKRFLNLEKSLSDNSVEAYSRDIRKLIQYFEISGLEKHPVEIKDTDLHGFLQYINDLGMSARSQARVISGVKSFFRYLLLEDIIREDPTSLLESPKIGRKLPEILSIEEIDLLIGAIDLSKPEGHRNRAILEVLYSCGLRVSELIGLKISDIYLDKAYLKVTGKGNKQRLVPIGGRAVKEIRNYLPDRQSLNFIDKSSENILFLNRRGKKLTRVMIFTIIKQLSEKANLQKSVSPHTFRHSFASHLVEGGADLRAVQEMLGHESILTTEIYTHLDREYLRETILQFHPRSNQQPAQTKG